MFKLNYKRSVFDRVKGLFSDPVQYEVRVPDANWSPYFGHYENQKWGQWDSDSCWCLSGINCLEDQCEMLAKQGRFSKEAMDFFTSNGYIDADGDFSFSERFIEIMSGVTDGGNNQMNFGVLAQQYGMIPRGMLTYSIQQAQQCSTEQAFVADYFNPNAVTQAMKDLGQQFLYYVSIEKQWIGKNWTTPSRDILISALKQAPIQLGVPIESPVAWNSGSVGYKGLVTNPAHAIELYAIDVNGNYLIFDQYMPNLKTLAPNYYTPLASQYVLNPIIPAVANPVPQPPAQVVNLWTNVFAWFNGLWNGSQNIGRI